MLSFKALINDVRRFIYNNLRMTLAVIIALVMFAQTLNYFFYPAAESLGELYDIIVSSSTNGSVSYSSVASTIEQLDPVKKQMLLPLAINYILSIALLAVVTNLIAMSSIIATIKTIVSAKYNAAYFFKKMFFVITKIVLFFLASIPFFIAVSILITMLTPLAMPLTLFVTLGYVMANLVFLAMLIDSKSTQSFKTTLKMTFAFIKSEFRLILPIFALWLLTFMLINVLSGFFANQFIIGAIIINAIELFASFVVICYLYRLYMLTNEP